MTEEIQIQELKCSCEQCDLRPLFFKHATGEQYKTLCSIKTERQFGQGDEIFSEGDEIHDFFYLKEGLVKLFRKVPGKEDQIITIAKPFDFVSLLSIFSDTHYKYSVTALHDSVVCVLPLDIVKRVCLENGNISMSLMEKMSRITDDVIKQFLDIRQRQLRGRIAFVLFYFAGHIFDKPTFDLPVSRREIAEYIGMTTENVIRILSEFRKDNIIGISGKTIEIKDMKRLQTICDLG